MWNVIWFLPRSLVPLFFWAHGRVPGGQSRACVWFCPVGFGGSKACPLLARALYHQHETYRPASPGAVWRHWSTQSFLKDKAPRNMESTRGGQPPWRVPQTRNGLYKWECQGCLLPQHNIVLPDWYKPESWKKDERKKMHVNLLVLGLVLKCHNLLLQNIKTIGPKI